MSENNDNGRVVAIIGDDEDFEKQINEQLEYELKRMTIQPFRAALHEVLLEDEIRQADVDKQFAVSCGTPTCLHRSHITIFGTEVAIRVGKDEGNIYLFLPLESIDRVVEGLKEAKVKIENRIEAEGATSVMMENPMIRKTEENGDLPRFLEKRRNDIDRVFNPTDEDRETMARIHKEQEEAWSDPERKDAYTVATEQAKEIESELRGQLEQAASAVTAIFGFGGLPRH